MRLWIIILLNAVTCVAVAQEAVSENYLDIERYRIEALYGISVPIGKFNSTDIEEDDAGYANSGNNINVSFQKLFRFRSYLSINFNTAAYELNTNSFARNISLFTGPSVDVDAQSSGYRMNAISFGYNRIFGREKVKGFFHPFLGLARLSIDKFSLELSDGQLMQQLLLEEAESEITLLYGFTTGVDIEIAKQVKLKVYGGVSSAAFDLEYEIKSLSEPTQEATESDQTLAYTVINIGSGLVISF